MGKWWSLRLDKNVLGVVDIAIIPDERIIGKIYYLRGKKVMFNKDLAELYDVETKDFSRSVRRNIDRFPDDFMFLLNFAKYS